jgi:hypothetical protein
MDQVDCQWLCTGADERVLSGRRAVMMVWWAAVGFLCSSQTFCFSWRTTLCIIRLSLLRVRLLGLCCTAAFALISLPWQLRKGPLRSCKELLQSCALWNLTATCSVGTLKLRLRSPRTVLFVVNWLLLLETVV